MTYIISQVLLEPKIFQARFNFIEALLIGHISMPC